MRFRKKPVVIEAVQWDGTNRTALERWMRQELGYTTSGGGEASLWIPTLEGGHYASRGDWIIRGVAGEFYPCKPGIFDATYEPAEAGRASGERELREALAAGDALAQELRANRDVFLGGPDRDEQDPEGALALARWADARAALAGDSHGARCRACGTEEAARTVTYCPKCTGNAALGVKRMLEDARRLLDDYAKKHGVSFIGRAPAGSPGTATPPDDVLGPGPQDLAGLAKLLSRGKKAPPDPGTGSDDEGGER